VSANSNVRSRSGAAGPISLAISPGGEMRGEHDDVPLAAHGIAGINIGATDSRGGFAGRPGPDRGDEPRFASELAVTAGRWFAEVAGLLKSG
jgi:hypothetical protein